LTGATRLSIIDASADSGGDVVTDELARRLAVAAQMPPVLSARAMIAPPWSPTPAPDRCSEYSSRPWSSSGW